MHPTWELKKRIFTLGITSLFFLSLNTQAQSPSLETFQKTNHILNQITNNSSHQTTNNFPQLAVKKIELKTNQDFPTDPALRPTQRDKLLINRMNESFNITLSSYSQFIYPLSTSINQQYYDNFDRNMQRATQRGVEWTLRSAFFDPLQNRIEGSSFVDGIGRMFLRDLSGWENDTLPDPRDPLREGLPGVRKTYLPEGFDRGVHLFRRNPYAHLDYKHENFSASVRVSAGSLTKVNTFTDPSPHLSFIAQLPLTKEIPIDMVVEKPRNSEISTYIGTHYDFDKGKKGSLILGFSPNTQSGYFLYNLKF